MAIISVVLPGFPAHAGGGYKVVYQYANFLAQAGHEVHIVQMRPDHLRDLKPPGGRNVIRAVVYWFGRRARPRWFKLDRRIAVTNFSHQDVAFIPKSDIVIATAMETADVVARASQLGEQPGVYFIQHYELWSDDPTYVDSTWKLPLHKVVIAPWLVAKAHELGETAVLVPNAIDAAAFPPGAPIAQRPLQVLALVSDLAWKRTDLVADVFSRLGEECPGVKLKTFGVVPKPASLPDFVEHVQSPSPEMLKELYQDSRVYLCASDREGWHLPPAEAMSSGAAVASTDIDGVRAYAQDTALFSPVGDPQALAANVMRLLSDVELCQQLASAGNQRMVENTPEAAAAQFESEILGVLSR